eukprot:4657289-Pyramimonas_sp.AAC.1
MCPRPRGSWKGRQSHNVNLVPPRRLYVLLARCFGTCETRLLQLSRSWCTGAQTKQTKVVGVPP